MRTISIAQWAQRAWKVFSATYQSRGLQARRSSLAKLKP
jgi:hypothetical protein